MAKLLKSLIKKVLLRFGYNIVPARWSTVSEDKLKGMDEAFFPIYEQSKDYTMTSIEKMHALFRAVGYLEQNEIPGDFVECGVAAGGSMMMAAQTLISCGSTQRNIWLYDTYAGMPEPTDVDVSYRGDIAREKWEYSQRGDHNLWCYTDLDSVQENMKKTGYPFQKLKFIKGKVEENIPDKIPNEIALLRLDTDWYASTAHELKYLYPRLKKGGVLIIDDYGHWEGCRKATEEFFSDLRPVPMLTRIDRLGVIAVKPN